MGWTNFHTHCFFCDGKGQPVEYLEAAKRHGLHALGFSSHNPLPFPTDWTMDPVRVSNYFQAVQELKAAASQQLASQDTALQQDTLNKADPEAPSIYLGMEIDYIPGWVSAPALRQQLPPLDYAIGSVHFLGQDDAGKHWTVDGSLEELTTGIRETFGGNVQRSVKAYYNRICEMVQAGGIDMIGHLDLIKKNNAHSRLFSEEETWYRNLVYETLEVISGSGLLLEANTGGMTRGYIDCLYPSTWILKHCYQLGIPLVLNSDAHSPSNLISCFDRAVMILHEVGYKELHTLCTGGWRALPFYQEGFSSIHFPA